MHLSIGSCLRRILGIQKRLENLHVRIKELDERVYAYSRLLTKNENGGETPIVVPFLSGGLGNQLFQISCAYELARNLNYSLALNYDLYASYGQGQGPKKYQDNFFCNFKTTTVIPEFKHRYTEHTFSPIKNLPHANILLEGYFQSSKYFSRHREELRHLFSFPEEAVREAGNFINKDARPVVGIHMRLGDYLNHPGLQSFPKTYFTQAAHRFPADSRFVICSDDPDGAYKIFAENRPYFRKAMTPEVYRGSSELSDLAFLSQCQNLVLSNSTFSYWGYFLGVPKTKVIAPKRWFNPKVHKNNHDDIYEKEWKLI